ncbi:MAG TPA: SDR family oxidoreductase [Prolixibacteraceae bacterium]|nr:SDR family oxidoreductase [Prolixibacteraceae bacterium]
MEKVILITGISSGFGEQTSRLLAERGHIVYGTLRKDGPAPPGVKTLIMDLTHPESIRAAVETVVQKEGRLDVLINNAGMHSGGPIEEAPPELFARQINTNVNGMVLLLQQALPHMRERGGGTIINISSIGGLMGLPFQGFYSASKFAIEGLSEALRMELKPFHINVIVINPGDFATRNTANRTNITVKNGPYEAQFQKSLAQIEKDETGGQDPVVLARKLCRIVESKRPCKRYVIASFEQKLAVALKRILPEGWFMGILTSHYKIG